MLKGYLTSQLEEKGNQLQNKATIEKEATHLNLKETESSLNHWFEFNAELDEIIIRIVNNAEKADTVRQLANEARRSSRKGKN